GTRVTLELGTLRFCIEGTVAQKPLARSFVRDYETIAGFWGASTLSVAGLLAAMAYFVPPLGVNDGHSTDAERVYMLQQYLGTTAENERAEETPAAQDVRESGTDGAPAPGESGALGRA